MLSLYVKINQFEIYIYIFFNRKGKNDWQSNEGTLGSSQAAETVLLTAAATVTPKANAMRHIKLKKISLHCIP